MKKLKHYQKADTAALADLIAGDVSFTVLFNILHGECDHVFTDGKEIIICHSNPPYPVWAWCKDPSRYSNILSIGECIKRHFPLDEYNVILQHPVLNHLSSVDGYFENVNTKMELLSYRLDNFIDAGYAVDGKTELASIEDLELLTRLRGEMALEMEGLRFTPEECRESIISAIENKLLYVWRNGEGEIVATACKGEVGGFGKVAMVYTVPKHRRKGYAINLVSEVTRLILDEGLIPTLYTDGGYNASNECYKKIGYVQVGRLLNICKF